MIGRIRHWLYLLVSFFTSPCWDLSKSKTFVIPKGHHRSTAATKEFHGNSLVFEVTFDESGIYQLEGEDHYDVNKLTGFKYGLSPHYNSARFGWRYDWGEIMLVAYTYVDGVRDIYDIGTCLIGQTVQGSITETDTEWIYRFKENEYRIFRGFSERNRFYDFPYFGGNKTAPHEIRIKLMFN
jgi:hypothetical protein